MTFFSVETEQVPQLLVPGASPMVGGNRCTFGPAFWCASPQNARLCGQGVSWLIYIYTNLVYLLGFPRIINSFDSFPMVNGARLSTTAIASDLVDRREQNTSEWITTTFWLSNDGLQLFSISLVTMPVVGERRCFITLFFLLSLYSVIHTLQKMKVKSVWHINNNWLFKYTTRIWRFNVLWFIRFFGLVINALHIYPFICHVKLMGIQNSSFIPLANTILHTF